MSFLNYLRYAPIIQDYCDIDDYNILDMISENGQFISCISFGGSYPMEISTNIYQLNEQKICICYQMETTG